MIGMAFLAAGIAVLGLASAAVQIGATRLRRTGGRRRDRG